VSEEELARVKTQIVASQIYKRDSMMGQAMEIGALEAIGLHWQDIDKMLSQLNRVTADEVQNVAKTYFSDDALTIATLDPQPVNAQTEGAARRAAAAHGH
jgi:zinc protease